LLVKTFSGSLIEAQKRNYVLLGEAIFYRYIFNSVSPHPVIHKLERYGFHDLASMPKFLITSLFHAIPRYSRSITLSGFRN
jgi:hypothetical protein